MIDNTYRKCSKNSIRAYQLTDGVVVEIGGLLLEFESGVLYEIKEEASFINPIYKKTGTKYNLNELEKILKFKEEN